VFQFSFNIGTNFPDNSIYMGCFARLLQPSIERLMGSKYIAHWRGKRRSAPLLSYTLNSWSVSIGALSLVQLQTLISRLLLRISLNDKGLLCLFRSHQPSCGRLEKSHGIPCIERSFFIRTRVYNYDK